jgi:hypothetical protein
MSTNWCHIYKARIGLLAQVKISPRLTLKAVSGRLLFRILAGLKKLADTKAIVSASNPPNNFIR